MTFSLQPQAYPPHANRPTDTLISRYRGIRSTTEEICRPLQTEDYVLQSICEVSPPKWHLAHTTWFFETFILAKFLSGFEPYDPSFNFLFNSYYNTIGDQFLQRSRGLISRPGVEEIYNYRDIVDEQMSLLLEQTSNPELCFLVEVGLNHEQQHQELLLTDIKHSLSYNPTYPSYREKKIALKISSPDPDWVSFPAGLRWLGHQGDGFAFDNETPRHRVFVESFEIQSRPVTVGDYMSFVEAGGYQSPRFWLSDGWAMCQQERWTAPLYWIEEQNDWSIYTLNGTRPLVLDEPVCHLSYYEADAFARWSEARLPTEAEWRALADQAPLRGNFLEIDHLHPIASEDAIQIFGDFWEWTSSAYSAYPGYQPPSGALGEYNGKFMSNQMVLRGGSCVTPESHFRRSYRNFFRPSARWQFSGLRLARNV